MTKSTKPSIFPLLWVMLFDHTSLNITFPILTLLFFDAHSSFFAPSASAAQRGLWYGACVAVPHIVNIIATPILSMLSDGLGRKKVLLIATFGAFLFAITAALGILWGMLSLLFLGRVIQGLFSRTNPIAQAVIGDISPKEKKVLHMGYLQTAISIGAFAGPIIGGYFAHPNNFATLNFSLPYFIAAFFGAISCAITYFVFQETLSEEPTHAARDAFKWQTIKRVFADRNVLHISLILLLTQLSWSMYYQFMPPILKTELHFSAHLLGIFVGVIALWLAIATAFGIRFLEQFFNPRQILTLSIYLVLAGLVMTILSCGLKQPLLIWVSAIPVAFGDVIAFSCLIAMYSNVVEQQDQGKVMGVCFIVIAIIWALTASLGGVLMGINMLVPLFVSPIGVLGAAILIASDRLKVNNR